mmetsp:Transcript_8005/g.9286  ORF Transcript_8005/g.9286 Transcript_8005/m.9286 type:complete len:211 (-) Transcript_8005:170-802(-)
MDDLLVHCLSADTDKGAENLKGREVHRRDLVTDSTVQNSGRILPNSLVVFFLAVKVCHQCCADCLETLLTVAPGTGKQRVDIGFPKEGSTLCNWEAFGHSSLGFQSVLGLGLSVVWCLVLSLLVRRRSSLISRCARRRNSGTRRGSSFLCSRSRRRCRCLRWCWRWSLRRSCRSCLFRRRLCWGLCCRSWTLATCVWISPTFPYFKTSRS